MSGRSEKGDKSGWKRGAGAYSRSYAKISTDARLEAIARKASSDYPNKDIVSRVAEESDVNAGFSGKVSSGNRPKHRQGSWKRA